MEYIPAENTKSIRLERLAIQTCNSALLSLKYIDKMAALAMLYIHNLQSLGFPQTGKSSMTYRNTKNVASEKILIKN